MALQMFFQAALATILAWLATRAVKLVTDIILKKEEFSLGMLFNDGGFPSSHTAFVVGLAASVYFTEGTSLVFLVALCFAIVVGYDSMKVRWIVGEHSRRLNETAKKGSARFVERVGHTPLEVVGGAAFGIIVPWLLYAFVY